MSQKKIYVYSPDGQGEGWYMEKEAPAGWVNSDPNSPEVEDIKEAQKQMDDLDAKQAADEKDQKPEVPAHTGGLTDTTDTPKKKQEEADVLIGKPKKSK